MKQTKLYSDVRGQQQPDGTYPFGKNGIQNDLDRSVFNEPGFKKMAASCPYKYNGIVETDSKPVLFSTNNVNSAIGFFNPVTELYEPILDDATWSIAPAKLKFSTDFYIIGQAQRNYKGELVIAFTDKRADPVFPWYLNCDNPTLTSLDDMRLFPYFKTPTIVGKEILGGRVAAGAYYIAIGYERNDGTSSPYSSTSTPVIVRSGSIAGSADKAIEVTITDVDTSYNSARVAIISRINGVTKAMELLDFLPIAGNTLVFTYNGDNLTRDIDITEVLTPPALYSKVGTIGQLNDALYIGDLEIEPDLNDMQPYALAIGIEWKSELVNAVKPPEEHINGTKKSFMHQEVYAVYVRYRKVRGGFTKWFITAGRTPLAGDLVVSAEAAAGGGVANKYEVEDTIHYFDAANKTGACGVWKNDTEVYPNTADFNASAIGGRDLRNQSVYHHRMPSLQWCKKNLYNTDDSYGKTHLDLLGIYGTNVQIPAKYIGVIDGYELGYAIRTVANMTIYGQGLVLHGMANRKNNDPIYTTGGNWKASIWHRNDNSFDDDLELQVTRLDSFRFHAFDLLFNRPSISPTFMSPQLWMRRERLREEGYFEDGYIDQPQNGPTGHLIDYTISGVAPKTLVPGNTLRNITSSFYLTDNTNINNFVNARHENCFAGLMAGVAWPMAIGDAGFRVHRNEPVTNADVGSPGYEETHLANLLVVKANIYESFTSQPLSSAGSAKALTVNTPFWGGDVFVSAYTYHTYGRHETNDGWGDAYRGKKVVRRFVCESVSNINLRYEIPGNIYSRWYPNNQIIYNNPDQSYPVYFDRSVDPNQFGYTKDFNALNNLISSVIFSPFREELTVFPFRVHRGGKLSRQGKARSWRTFLPLDYYEMQKNMGRIVNVLGMDDTLLIHMENALFRTQDKAKLESNDSLSITLGAGDIFQFEPQEAESAKLGYAGTQHDLACVQTPVGYVFVDSKQGEIYLYKGKLANLNLGVNNFFREFLRVVGKNNYTGNGITIGWDQKYKRIILTVKNQGLPAKIKPFVNTPDFWNSLSIGDLVWYQNRLVEYKGLNDVVGFDCPATLPAVFTTWEKFNSFCILKDGINTGYKGWASRRRKIDNILDGYTEANTPVGGLGTYFPPELDTVLCPVPAPTVTWKGGAGYCEQTLGVCKTGWQLNSNGTICEKRETMAPTVTAANICVVRSQLAGQYSSSGTKVYGIDHGTHLDGPVTQLLTTGYWREQIASVSGPMNSVGIWIDTNCDGLKDALVADSIFEFSRNIPSANGHRVYVGMGGDNAFKLFLNGTLLVECTTTFPAGLISSADNFNFWHLVPVDLPAGNNILNFQAIGDGSTNDSLGVMIYNNTLTEIMTAQADSDLDIIFRTTDLMLGFNDLASCPVGWILDTSGGAGNYVCRRTITEAPVPSGQINTGRYIYTTRCRYINGIPDGYCEPNTAGPNFIVSEINYSNCRIVKPGLGCGFIVSEGFSGTIAHTYVEETINIFTGQVKVQWVQGTRPTKFTLMKNGIEFQTSGWKGNMNYAGPWGAAITTPPVLFGEFLYTPVIGDVYTMKVEAAAADAANIVTHNFTYTITCL